MATYVLPICSARQHETSVILFFSSEPSFYTVTHFPIRAFANSTNGWISSFPSLSLGQVIRGDIPRNLRRFCCTALSLRVEHFASARLPDAVSHSSRKIAWGSLRWRTVHEQEHKKRIQYLLKVRTTERKANVGIYWYHWRIIRASRN